VRGATQKGESFRGLRGSNGAKVVRNSIYYWEKKIGGGRVNREERDPHEPEIIYVGKGKVGFNMKQPERVVNAVEADRILLQGGEYCRDIISSKIGRGGERTSNHRKKPGSTAGGARGN